jgi:hypothetical protein
MEHQLGCFHFMFALLQGKFEDVRVHVVTRHGYRVEAPVGLAFGCYQPGKTERFSPLSFPQ